MGSDSYLRSYKHVAPELRLFQGPDSLVTLRRELERNGCKRAVVLCGRSMSVSPAMELLRSALGSLLVGQSVTVREHSPVPAVQEAASFLEERRADSVIAVGGGSAAVTARAAAILLAENRPLQDLCTRRAPGGKFESPKLNAAKLPLFVIPTTPSTAFVKVGTAVHDPEGGERLALFDPKTRAKGIFIHPDFVSTSPETLIQGATLNTLSTAVEALESPNCDPISEAMLMQSLRLITQHLHPSSGMDVSDRERLVLAGVLCGRGTDHAGGGLATVLAHAIGKRSTVSNGIVHAIVLPHTMRFNAPCTQHAEGRVADGLLGYAKSLKTGPGEMSGVELVESLLASLGVPTRLRDIGISSESLPEIAEEAMDDWFIGRNARRIADAGMILAVLEAAW